MGIPSPIIRPDGAESIGGITIIQHIL